MRGRVALLLLLFIVDRSIKRFVWISLAANGGYLYPVLNKNISFSLDVSWSGALFVPVLFAVTAFLAHRLITQYRRSEKDFVWWGLVTAGAVSNLMDRITLGGVLDYIDLKWWPVFNVSDAYIFIGVAALILGEFKNRRAKKIAA